MNTSLIGPDGLEVDAVVPQCLDNEFVSDRVFSAMVERGVDYLDCEIARERDQDFRTEFVRSLVYSSQVVVQRAFFKNSEFLYKNYLPENGENLRAFAELMRQKAVIPYLFRESSLNDDAEFDVSRAGDRATRRLLEEVGDDVTCVRLAVDDAANSRVAASVSTEFGSRMAKLNFMPFEQRNAMAQELFSDSQRLQEPGAWDAFNQAVSGLARYSFEKAGDLQAQGRQLTRQDVYRDNFVVDGRDDQRVVNGRFKRPGRDNPFLLELKKYSDLVYNTNLPDHLKRYTFTPANMPSRMALQDAPGEGYRHEELSAVVSDRDALDRVRRTFMAHSQKAMNLPLLSQLKVADIVEIRALPEWVAFKEAQAQILKQPLQCLELLDRFQRDFDRFQRALSHWYNAKYARPKTENRYCSYVSLALSLGGALIAAGSDMSAYQQVIASFASERGAQLIPKKIKGYAAKLVVGVYDLGRQQLDADRTYTIELMQTNNELMREDVLELLDLIHRKSGSGIPNASEQVADQGIL